MAERKKYLSPSQLEMLAKCGAQYSFRYIDGIKSPPGVAMIIGTATHKAIEKDLTSKRDTKALLEEADVADIAAETLKNTWAGEEPELLPDEKEEGAKAVKASAIDTSVSLAKLHHNELAPKIEPLYLEREVYLELKGFPYDLKGYLDIQEADRIRDTKTRSKAPDSEEAEKSVQLQFYSLARTVLDSKPPAEVALDVLVKKKVPEIVTQTAQMLETDHARLLQRVQAAGKVLQAGAFMPAAPGSWYCSAKWCGYWNRCPYGSRQRVQG